MTASAPASAGPAFGPGAHLGRVLVCYEADELDPVRHTGWSVIATEMARLVTRTGSMINKTQCAGQQSRSVPGRVSLSGGEAEQIAE